MFPCSRWFGTPICDSTLLALSIVMPENPVPARLPLRVTMTAALLGSLHHLRHE